MVIPQGVQIYTDSLYMDVTVPQNKHNTKNMGYWF